MFFSKFFKKPAKKTLGLALGSGGAKGMAHIGALKAFEENGIEFDVVAGASIGSIVGAFYCNIYRADEILHLLETVNFKEITNMFMVKMDTVGLEDVINRYIGDLTFDELKKPFACTATDYRTGEEVDLKSGSVAKALCASSSYPPFFKPVSIDGRLLVDGAFSNAVPADLVRGMGADFVVGIDLSAVKSDKKSFIGEWLAKMPFEYGNTSEKGYKNSDIMLKPPLSQYSAASFAGLHDMYEIGYETALGEMPAIRAAINALYEGKKKKEKLNGAEKAKK
ncbi:MAG: hypothetical protein DBX59_00615 [Bacillota bacterium]|nr:MAG: hypothetical protein DBX59_00615 [Bacillota bacterium]